MVASLILSPQEVAGSATKRLSAASRSAQACALSARLLAIDERAREAEVRGEGFDFIAAYDAAIGDAADRLGLIDEMRRQLRPGVQLFLQTREPELLSIRTARLNRLAVYLMIKACERAEREHFDHVVCNEARVLPRGAGAARTMIEIDCGGRVIAADRVIARRGPAKDQILEPFAALLAGHAAEHDAWVRRFPKDSIAPELAPATHAHFARLARAARIPPPRYRLEEMRAAMPVRVKLSLTDDCARWSGDLAVDDVANAWSGDAPPLQLAVAADPDSLGCPLAHAVARLTIHAPRAQGNDVKHKVFWVNCPAAAPSPSPSVSVSPIVSVSPSVSITPVVSVSPTATSPRTMVIPTRSAT